MHLRGLVSTDSCPRQTRLSGTVEIDAGQARHTGSKRAVGDREVRVEVIGAITTRVAIR
jgi:hypothetical protein